MNQSIKYRVWMIVKLCFLSISIFYINLTQAQVVLNGAQVHSLGTSIIYIQTDSLLLQNEAYFRHDGLLLIDKDLIVNDGFFDLDGTVDINGNLLNNDSIFGNTLNSQILLQGNWINNQIFIPGFSSTILDGTTQNITGSQISSFYNLQALGVLTDVKRLVGVDALVLNLLDLGDVELATDQNTLSVQNTSPNAILRNNGFVSSLDVGRLERLTNSISPYLFPTGSSAGLVRYRPIELTPNNASLDTFGVRLANLNATNEGYDVLLLGDSLCAVNPNFYHRIYGTNAADITMFYLPAEDGDWDAMAQWQASDVWEAMPNELPSSAGQFSTLSIPSWNDFSENSFALGLQKPFLELDDQLEVELGQSIELLPNYVGPNPQSILWFPFDEIDCPNCLETEITPSSTGYYNLEIGISQNCILRDSVLILVNTSGIFLPTGFSPNGDGVNDLFRPLNNNLESYNIRIYNRWGELIYQSSNFLEGWDGTYRGSNADIGVYTFQTEYSFKNQSVTESFSGNVTLIR